MTPRKTSEQRQRLRLLYSLGDFQLALSAAAFLAECDPEAKYSKVQLRRFRCYETAMIMGYCRPFSQSKGGVPPLTLKLTGVKLTGEQKKIHNDLLMLRNKVIGHSDEEMMRMVTKSHSMKLREELDFVYFHAVFDEGVTFLGTKLWAVDDLLHRIYDAVYNKLLEEAQEQPSNFDLRKDYLDP